MNSTTSPIYALHVSAGDDRPYVRPSAEIRRQRLFVVFGEPGDLLGNEDDKVGVFARLDD